MNSVTEGYPPWQDPRELSGNPFVAFTLRVARIPKDGDIDPTGCIHCGFSGDLDIAAECPGRAEHEYARPYRLTPETAWEVLTTLVGEARALTGTPTTSTGGVWVEIEIEEDDPE